MLRFIEIILVVLSKYTIYILNRITGIGPYRIDSKSNRIRISLFSYVYSCFYLACAIVALPFSGVDILFFNSNYEKINVSTFVNIIEFFLSYITVVVIMSVQNLRPLKLAKCLNEGWKILGGFSNNQRSKLIKINFIVNLLVLVPTLLAFGLNIHNLNFIIKPFSPPIIIIDTIITSTPALTITLFVIIYNGVMMVISEKLEVINHQINIVLHKAKAQCDSRKKPQLIILSVELDNLANEYVLICHFAKHFQKAHSLQILCIITNIFYGLISQVFFFYVTIAIQFRGDKTAPYNNYMTGNFNDKSLFLFGGIMYGLMNTMHMAFVIMTPSRIVKKAQLTVTMLHDIDVHHLDLRWRESVLFSILYYL